MPVTTLDPKTALIVIDLQKGIVPMAPDNQGPEVVKKCVSLIEAFRSKDLPVVLVNVKPGAPGRTEQSRNHGDLPADFAELVPELKKQPSDHTVTKRSWGAFMHTDLEAHLKMLRVTQVVICGIATSIGVESTARQAYELGFNVTLAVDAMADLKPEAHTNSITRIFPRLGETGTCQDILALVDKAKMAA